MTQAQLTGWPVVLVVMALFALSGLFGYPDLGVAVLPAWLIAVGCAPCNACGRRDCEGHR